MRRPDRKPSFPERLAALFRHRSSPAGTPAGRTVRMMDALEERLPAWIAGKEYRHPDRTLSDTARRMGTDSAVLQRYFSERRQEDFRTWRTRLRIEDAKQLLVEEPDTPASEIAARVGFSDRSNFSRQFVAATGLTPGVWRKKAARLTTDSLPE